MGTLLTLFAVLGIFLAGNLLTMLLFFELMTITPFWVIHRWNKEAIEQVILFILQCAGGLL